MIECTENNIYYKKRPKNKRVSSVFLVFLIIISSVLYYRFVILVNLFEICSSNVFSYTNDAVNTSILSTFKEKTSYGDFIKVEKNDKGEITLISADTYKINMVNKEIVSKTKSSLDAVLKDGIKIPFMAFTGIKVLSGYGKKVNFKAVAVESVNSEFQSEFTSVGINQTLHSIYVLVVCDVNLHTSIKKQTERVETKVLISESVLVGKVPEVYLGGNLFN